MNLKNEIFFRIAFGVLWVVYFRLRLYFQGKVKSVGKYVLVNEKQEMFFFRLFAVAFILLPIYFITSWIDFAHLPLPIWTRWTGGTATCIGIGLFRGAHQALGLNWTVVLALSEKHGLVTRRPFRYVRHPMYAAFLSLVSVSYFYRLTG